MDLPSAKAYMQMSDAVAAVKGGGKAERVPTDPTEAFVERIVSLQLALELTKTNVSDEVSGTWKDKANELIGNSKDAAQNYFDWTNRPEFDKDSAAEGEEDLPEPEVSSFIKTAVKLAEGKATKAVKSTRKVGSGGGTSAPFLGERRDIAAHIASAFADLPSGSFLTVGEIQKKKSVEYGDDTPSAGAISVRLFPTKPGAKMSVEGVTPSYSTDGKHKKGATKI